MQERRSGLLSSAPRQAIIPRHGYASHRLRHTEQTHASRPEGTQRACDRVCRRPSLGRARPAHISDRLQPTCQCRDGGLRPGPVRCRVQRRVPTGCDRPTGRKPAHPLHSLVRGGCRPKPGTALGAFRRTARSVAGEARRIAYAFASSGQTFRSLPTTVRCTNVRNRYGVVRLQGRQGFAA